MEMYQYSYGLLSDYCLPGNFTGVMVQLETPSIVSWTVCAVNGWDVNNDNNDEKTFGTRFDFSPRENIAFGIAALHGAELNNNNSSRRTIIDGDFTINPRPNWTIGGEVQIGWETKVLEENHNALWNGILLMNNIKLNERFGITARFDYLNDKHGNRTGDVQELKSVCLAPSVSLMEGLRVMYEIRYDWSNVDYFGNDEGDSQRNAVTSAFEFTYGF